MDETLVHQERAGTKSQSVLYTQKKYQQVYLNISNTVEEIHYKPIRNINMLEKFDWYMLFKIISASKSNTEIQA